MKYKTISEWKRQLGHYYAEALEGYDDSENWWTANEIFDQVVSYMGGLGSGYEARSLIKKVYGVDLREVAKEG